MSDWIPAERIALLPQWHSAEMRTKPLLLALPFHEHALC